MNYFFSSGESSVKTIALLLNRTSKRGKPDPEGALLQITSDLPEITPHQVKSIFWKVFLFAFVIQMVKTTIYITDGEMWAQQIQHFLNSSSAVFNFRAAYGHPGTTLVGLGCLFHILFGFSFNIALTLSVALLIAAVTAACAALCFLLQPQSLWWFTTGFILTLSRFFVTATVPTAAVMPFITLIVLASCWLWVRTISTSGWHYFLWGIMLGLSAATRLDISLFVGIPFFILLSYRSGIRVMVPILTGGLISFIFADPFLWFMPVQHVIDLWSKFTLHYSNYGTERLIPWMEWIHGIPLAILAIAWFLVLYLRRRLSDVIPAQVLLVFLGISLLAVLLLTSSKFQTIRYLYPLIIVWEIFLPQFALQNCPRNNGQVSFMSGSLDAKTARVIMGFIIPTQVLGYFFIFNV